MRYFPLLLLPLALSAQSPAESDQRVTQALITEVRELRLAIERSTLLNARTTLAISQLQMQEQSVARLSTQLNDVRTASQARRITALTERIQERESKRTAPEFATPQRKELLEGEISNMKEELQMVQAMETGRAAREGEISSQLMAAQNQIAASRARIDEMERALDAAIQQLLKK